MSTPAVTITFRIPGQWLHPRELVERLPAGYRLTPDTLFMPDGTEIEFWAAPADGQFAEIFRRSCRDQPTAEEMAAVDHYTVNVFLAGPGGSLAAARTMMKAAAAVVRAGGAGVFIDNSTVAHGGQQWLAMTDDGGPDALSFAFIAVVGGKTEAWTMGMHVFGMRDFLMKRADAEAEDFGIIDVVRYACKSDKPIDDGHILADLDGPRFQAFVQDTPKELARSPLHNPFGRLKLVNVKDIAEAN